MLQLLSAAASLIMSFGKPVCTLLVLSNYITVVIAMIDILTIFMVNIQFFLPIAKPFFYKSNCNQTGYWIVLILSWIVFITVMVVSYYYKNFRTVFIYSVGISSLFIYVILCVLFLIVSKEVESMLKRADTSNKTLTLKYTLKRTRTLASSALLAFTITVVPIAVSNFVFDMESPTTVWLIILLKFNGVLDPIIYCIRMKSIHKPIFLCLKKCVKCPKKIKVNKVRAANEKKKRLKKDIIIKNFSSSSL